ncbi:hypothetical protein [Labrenzia sp. PHM005]|uniref:hypothetical protein n=1 Tax=Labrenzia sp. PHM005 TaxID=2590016 RepID=UPI0011401FC8|nr:hypothetical protein [Labrenzia sp. PHM005]QDG74588.1 hypothetical protein FJ695_01165 [Labrenzia sp. PHM005]
MYLFNVRSNFSNSFRTPFRSTGLLTISAAIALYAGNATAQTKGLDAFNAYVSGLKSLGLTVENGAIDYDGTTDTLTISDTALGFGGTIADIPADNADIGGNDTTPKLDLPKKTDLTYEMSFSSGTMTIVGLSEDNNVFAADSWTYSDDSSLSISAKVNGEGRFKVDGRLAGTLAENYRFTMPELPTEDAKRPASRWLPFMKTTLLASYDEVRVDSTALTFEAYAEEGESESLVASGTMQLDGYKMAGADNGRIELYSLDKLSQTLQTLDAASGQMLVQTTTQGKTVYEGIDANPLIALFDPSVSEKDEKLTVIRQGSAVDYVSSQELGDGIALKITVDRNSLNDFTIQKRESDILGLLDGVLTGETPEPQKLITSLFQIYRSFGIADARVSGIGLEVTNPEEDMTVNATIKEVAVTDFNSNGIGEMMVVGLSAPDLPEGAAVSLDWAAIGGIEFADFDPMEAMISTLIENPDYGDDNPLEVVRAFMPHSFGYELEGLKVVVPDYGLSHIGRAEMKVSTTVPPIPTSYYAKNEGIQIPVATLDDEDMEKFLEALGITEIVWSDETRLYWDEATKELNLERLTFEMEGVGRAEASVRFANVPKALFEDPEGQGQMALVVAQFVEAKISFTDDGVTENGLAHIAGQENIPVNVFREALAEQAAEATAPIQNAAFTDMVRTAVSDFLKNPGEISLTLTPSAPVPVAQIVGSLAAPQTLPDLLNVKVKAN